LMVFLIGLFQTWWYWLFLHLNQQTMYLVTVYHHNAVTIHPVKIYSFLKYQYIHHDWLVFNANFSCITAVFNIYILTLIKQSFQGGWYVPQTKLSGGWYVPFAMKNGDWWFVHTRFQKRNVCAQYALFL
jgi:hypothetical protein